MVEFASAGEAKEDNRQKSKDAEETRMTTIVCSDCGLELTGRRCPRCGGLPTTRLCRACHNPQALARGEDAGLCPPCARYRKKRKGRSTAYWS